MICIGYAVEGWRDRAFVRGLADRWCPGTQLIEGRFRGSTGLSLRRELARACTELLSHGADFIVVLRDANKEDWQEVRTSERARVPAAALHCTVYGVAERSIEDWLNADPGYLAAQLGVPLSQLPSRSSSQAEALIAAVVRDAPLDRWIPVSRSFETFYEDARSMAQRSGRCAIPNERET
ncbi:MAG: hypothetical protein FJ291_26340 [Planctomycetes bacterium]|nr:hypothetical protein [Planctomycetota bacterium]